MPKTLTEQFPPLPLDELVAQIKAFPEMSLEEKRSFLTKLVASHVTLNLNWGGQWTYRRARKLEPDKRPTSVDELIWRKGAPAKLGRANPEGFDVIYVSDRQDTALREARIIANPAVVAEFGIRAGRSVRVAPLGEFSQIVRTGRGALLGDQSDAITNHINACARDEATSLVIADTFLRECFFNDDGYSLSSHVARAIFEKNPEISAIAYASRQQPGAINYAVRVETFWQNWALIGVRYGDAQHLACGFYRLLEPQAVDGVSPDGCLQWVDVEPNSGHRLEPYVPANA